MGQRPAFLRTPHTPPAASHGAQASAKPPGAPSGYTGPAWLPRLLGRVVPRPDLFLVLDLDVETALARKQELPAEELLRHRAAYRRLAGALGNAVMLDAARPEDEVATEAARHIAWRATRGHTSQSAPVG